MMVLMALENDILCGIGDNQESQTALRPSSELQPTKILGRKVYIHFGVGEGLTSTPLGGKGHVWVGLARATGTPKQPSQ